MGKRKIFGSLVLTGMLLFGSEGVDVFAASKSSEVNTAISSTYLNQQINNMNRMGISKSKQDRLIEKIKKGKVLDADNPTKVKAVEDKLVVSPKEPIKRYEFEDGSVMEVGVVPNPSKTISTMGQSCGTGYCNFYDYKVYAKTTTIETYAYADFSIAYGLYAAEHISRFTTPYVQVLGGTYTLDKKEIAFEYEDVYIPRDAYAYGSFYVTYYGSTASSLKRLRLYAGQDKYRVSLY